MVDSATTAAPSRVGIVTMVLVARAVTAAKQGPARKDVTVVAVTAVNAAQRAAVMIAVNAAQHAAVVITVNVAKRAAVALATKAAAVSRAAPAKQAAAVAKVAHAIKAAVADAATLAARRRPSLVSSVEIQFLR